MANILTNNEKRLIIYVYFIIYNHNMNKKDYIWNVLEKLSTYRPIARWLEVLLKEDKLTDSQISWLLAVFDHAIKEATDRKQKDKLQKGIDAIKKLQSLEEDQDKQDAKDIQELDKMLENI